MLPSGQTKTISVITSLLYHLFTMLHNYFPNDLHAVSRCLRSSGAWISHCWLIENRASSSDTCIPSLLHNDARQQLHKHRHTQSAARLKSHIDLTPVHCPVRPVRFHCPSSVCETGETRLLLLQHLRLVLVHLCVRKKELGFLMGTKTISADAKEFWIKPAGIFEFRFVRKCSLPMTN